MQSYSSFNFNEKPTMWERFKKHGISLLVEILIAILAAFLMTHFGLEKTTMMGDSMKTTLKDGDKILVNKMIYHISSPKRNDVIVFRQTGKEHDFYNVKRIIGLPGETVLIQNGQVYINGDLLDEKITVDGMKNGGLANEELVLDDDEYFVLGDNRNNSEDSRFANVGNIVKSDVVGKAWIRLNPFNFINSLGKN